MKEVKGLGTIVLANIYITCCSQKGLVQERVKYWKCCPVYSNLLTKIGLLEEFSAIWPSVGLCKSWILLTELHFYGAERIDEVDETKSLVLLGIFSQTAEQWSME